jgi:hypothetical protein
LCPFSRASHFSIFRWAVRTLSTTILTVLTWINSKISKKW